MRMKEEVNLRLKINDTTQVISTVYFVPSLKNNLLSVGQLQHKRLKTIVENNACEICHKQLRRLIMLSTMTSNRMFVVTAGVKGPR